MNINIIFAHEIIISRVSSIKMNNSPTQISVCQSSVTRLVFIVVTIIAPVAIYSEQTKIVVKLQICIKCRSINTLYKIACLKIQSTNSHKLSLTNNEHTVIILFIKLSCKFYSFIDIYMSRVKLKNIILIIYLTINV